MTLPWYKRYPRDAVFDHVGLGPDLIGALNTIVDLIYAAGEPIQNDPRWLGRLLGCPTKRARAHHRRGQQAVEPPS